MNSIVLWVAALAIGTAATVYGAAADAPPMHMALTAASALGLVGLALVERRRLLASGASEEVLSAATAIAMAVVWAWAALSLLVTYVFISTWGEWWQYVLGAGAVALICFFFSATLARDAAAGREDAVRRKAFALMAASEAAPKKKIALAAQSGLAGSRGILASAIRPIMAMIMPAS